ncbi:hypothetical protein Lal_00023881 [Lupinus albus]|uniref:Putative large ribosomal RNA subunit accumulation protein YceD n=1 Tax=Lupinus albus TaxID=3870 RepID=A0A6A4PI12_LUPAL|nr:putative large ribosomal RNA subunit accumulation protein YceD [Lupinus albus]KAF1887873.1 hypothetical protein Lal_00023881 [Lupinus albus]
MSLVNVIPSSYVSPLNFSILNSKQKFTYSSLTPFPHRIVSSCKKSSILYTNRRNGPNVFRCKWYDYESFTEESAMPLDLDDGQEFDDTGSPWEGAVVYKRNTSVSHLEYCTTLERLGLGKLSTDVSKTRASVMGLRVTKSVKKYVDGTPVQISIDVTRKSKKLRLDGIIKTVISLLCNRCCMPSAEAIFTEFSLLLTEDPIEEPETIDLGVFYGADIFKSSGDSDDDDDNDALIDLDDQLYFPPEEKEIDISKNIRDRVHLEITMNSICDSGCKGLCLKCGQNLNTGNCNCSKEVKEKNYGPLGNLKEQMKL